MCPITPQNKCSNSLKTKLKLVLLLHILLECAILKENRERLIAAVAKADNWPINKEMLIKKHYKAFTKFTKQINSKKLTKIKHSGVQLIS